MAFDEKLAARIRDQLATEKVVDEIKMFGGLCFKVNGNMACGVMNDDLIVKCDPERYDALLEKPNTKEFDFTGKPMRGIMMVSPAGIKTAATLRGWIKEGVEFAKSKPPKPKKKKKKKKKARKMA